MFDEIFLFFKNNLDLKKNIDLLKKEIIVDKNEYELYFLTSMIDPVQFDCMVDSILNSSSYKQMFNNNKVSSISYVKDLNTALFFLYSGAVILFEKNDQVIISIDIRKYPTRGIGEPETEKGVRTSKDGFVETLIFNIALIRRRIKSPDLKVEHFIVSNNSKSSVVLMYMDSVVDKKILNTIKTNIQDIKTNSLVLADKSIEDLLLKQDEKIFPLVKYSERPDVTSIQILNGKIAILIDTSSTVLLLPCDIFDHLRHIEEYKESFIIGSFTRFLRTIGVFLSIFLLPIYICLVTDKQILNGFIDISFSSEVSTPFYLQVLVAYLILEILRIASIHSPSTFSTSLSLVAALILGDVALSLDLFLKEVLLIVAFSTICSFATPSYELSLSNRFISFILIILSLIFGFEGLMIGILLTFMYLVTIKSFSHPYLYPMCPFALDDFLHLFIRKKTNDKKNN